MRQSGSQGFLKGTSLRDSLESPAWLRLVGILGRNDPAKSPFYSEHISAKVI